VAAVGVHVKRGASPGTPLKEDSKFSEVVPGLVELEVAVPRLRPAVW
jgi:hypothetical protein